MKVIKFFSNLGGIILFYGVISFLSLILVVFTDKKENPYGNRCVVNKEYNFSELFKDEEVSNITYRIGCNTYYVIVNVSDELSEDRIRALLIKFSLIKDQEGIKSSVEVIVNSDKPYFARLLDEGKVLVVG